jgi:hypothetical protein
MRIFARIRDLKWRIDDAATAGVADDENGNCRPATRKILVRSGLNQKRRLEVTLHEMLHAAVWDLDESAVHHTAHDLAEALWKLGWRLKPDKKAK